MEDEQRKTTPHTLEALRSHEDLEKEPHLETHSTITCISWMPTRQLPQGGSSDVAQGEQHAGWSVAKHKKLHDEQSPGVTCSIGYSWVRIFVPEHASSCNVTRLLCLDSAVTRTSRPISR